MENPENSSSAVSQQANTDGPEDVSSKDVTTKKARSKKIIKLNDSHSEPEDKCDPVIQLKKRLGLLEGVTMIIGIVIGSGIFVSPKGVIQYTGSVGMSLAVWTASGLITMVGALCFAELGTMIPESGGMYSYLYEAFGALPAFLYMWVTAIIRNSAGCAIVALTFSNYLLQPIVGCGVVPDDAARLIAAALICFLSWLNCMNVKCVSRIQTVFTLVKVLALVVVIVAGVFHLLWGHVENYQDPMAGTNWRAAAIATAFYQSLFSYSGWENLYYVVEELQNPNRNIPLSIIISTSLVTLVYVLTNIAYLAVLTPSEMLASNAVAMSFANQMHWFMGWIMPVFVMFSTFGAMNGVVFTQSRLLYVGARRGQFPESLSLLHYKYFTPVPSIVLNAVLSLLMFVTSDIGALINYSTFAVTVTQLACMCALFWFRYKEPQRERPFKVWLILPIIFSLVSLFLMVMPLIERPVEVGVAIGIVISGFPVYYVAIYNQDIANKFSGILNKMTYVSQLLFLGLPEDKQD